MDGSQKKECRFPVISYRKSRSKPSPYNEATSRRRSRSAGVASSVDTERDQADISSLPHQLTCLRYAGYKQEKIVQQYNEGQRIVMIGSGSSKHEIRKLLQILNFVNAELSSPEINFDHLMYCKSFLYIGKSKQVLGCLVAEPIEFAHRVVPSETRDDRPAVFCSTEKVPALCGISRIWVHACHRKEGIASKLLDTACHHFIYGHPLDPSSIAFSQPTGDGKNLAIHYTRNSAFLIYPEEAVRTDQVHLD